MKTHEINEDRSCICLSVPGWRLSGCGPRFLKLGHAVRYDRDDIERYIEEARRASTSDPGALHSEGRA